MKNIKKSLIMLLMMLFIPNFVHAGVYFTKPVQKSKNIYQFELKIENENINYIRGHLSIKNGELTKVIMDSDFKNETSTNNEFYFYHDGVKKGTYKVATFEVTITDNSKYEVLEFDRGINKCFKDKYDNYFDNNGNIVSKKEYSNICSKSSDATLKSLSISSGKISPTFNPTLELYSANVENDISEVTFSAIPNDKNAKVISGIKCALSEGPNICKIVVEAENKDKKTYQITVVRKNSYNKKESSDASIRNLEVHGGELTKTFKESKKTYDVLVNKKTKEIYFTFIMNSNDEEFTSKPCKITDNTKTCKLTITAEDGKTKNIFTFNIINEDKESSNTDDNKEDKTSNKETTNKDKTTTNNSNKQENIKDNNEITSDNKNEEIVSKNPIKIEEDIKTSSEEPNLNNDEEEKDLKKDKDTVTIPLINKEIKKDLFYGIILIITLGLGLEIGAISKNKKLEKEKSKKNKNNKKGKNKK